MGPAGRSAGGASRRVPTSTGRSRIRPVSSAATAARTANTAQTSAGPPTSINTAFAIGPAMTPIPSTVPEIELPAVSSSGRRESSGKIEWWTGRVRVMLHAAAIANA